MFRSILLGLISIYQRIWSSWMPPRCRYYPSCSVYAQEALKQYPLHRAFVRISWRLLRCQPFSTGGVDLP